MKASGKGLAAAVLVVLAGSVAADGNDPFQWLEDVQGEKALAGGKQQNAKSTTLLEARAEYKPVFARTLEILDSKEKIASPELRGETVYNFWKDDAHERGRRVQEAGPQLGARDRRRRAWRRGEAELGVARLAVLPSEV